LESAGGLAPPDGGFADRCVRCFATRPDFWKRDSESHGAYVLMRHARRLRLPSRIDFGSVKTGGRGGCCPRNARSARAARLAAGCGHLSIRVSSVFLLLLLCLHLRRPIPGGATVGAEGGSRTRVSVLPRLRTAVVRHRRGVPARGVAPLFLPCPGSGLRLTYAGSWSGSGDLHAAVPAPQAGGTLSSPEPGSALCPLPVAFPGVTDRSRTG
jgi:hypothetical protein